MTGRAKHLLGIAMALLVTTLSNGQIVLSNAYYEATSLTNTTVDMYGKSELRVTGTGNPVTGCTINMKSIDSWVFLPNVKPSGVTYLGRFKVNGANAVNNSNVKVVQYDQGTVIIPYPSNFQPMEVFTLENFCGDSTTLSANTAYGIVMGGDISSFVLKRGYTATLSQNSNGTGVSINYVAADGDLKIAALPAGLNNQVRFIRIFPWHWVTKKGSCDIAPTALNAKWYYNWNISGTAANSNYEYVAIKQQPNWPGLSQNWAYMGVNHLSGYNEPDNSVEDAYKNLSPPGSSTDAANRFPELLGTGLRVGAPAVTDGGVGWLQDYMDLIEAAGHRMDYIPIHYYRASNNTAGDAEAKLYAYLKDVYDRFHKPIWLTEFNNGANWTGGMDPTFAQNSTCIEAMINMMDDAPWVERYSVYSAVEEVRQIYYNAGGYTPMGTMYKNHASPLAYQQIIPGEGMDPSASYDFEGTLEDGSGSGNHAVSRNYPDFVAGHSGGTAIQFDGVDDHVILPDSLSDSTDFTFAAWVYWNGGSAWQRIFDFGIMDSSEYMFLTPSSGSALRFAITTSGWGGEQRLTAPSALPINTWTHVAVTINGNTGRLYMNGSQVAVNTSMTLNPSSLEAIQHYLGRSQFPADPYFSGKIDDVVILDQALSATQISQLQTTLPPGTATNVVDGGSIMAGDAYSGSVAGTATDPEVGAITYSKVYGPDWISIAANGALAGTPAYKDAGLACVTVRATDPAGASTYFILEINVQAPPYNYDAGPVVYWDFADAGAANGAFMPGNGERADLDSDGTMDTDDFRIGSVDLSGNGNHLTAWTSSWMKWSTDSTKGDLSMIYNNSWPAAGTDSAYNPDIQSAGYTNINAEAITPTNWTVEAVFKAEGTSGTQTILGRDGRYVGGSSSDNAALYFSMRGTALAIDYFDVGGKRHNLQVAAGLSAGTWYQAAATSDGSTLRLYLDGSEIGSKDLTTTGSDTALGLGYGTWSVARGMLADGHTDRFFGAIDAVAISGVTLLPATFVLNDAPPPEAPTNVVAVSGDSQVTLTWNAASNATSYSVKAFIFSGGPYVVVGNPITTNFVKTGLPNGSPRYFVVSASNQSGESPNSSEVHATPSVDIAAGEFVIDAYSFVGGTNASITVSNAVPGHYYQILATDSLTMPDWQPVGMGETGAGSDLLFDIPIEALSTNRYFQIDVQRQ